MVELKKYRNFTVMVLEVIEDDCHTYEYYVRDNGNTLAFEFMFGVMEFDMNFDRIAIEDFIELHKEDL